MNILTKSECCVCLISVARNVPSTQVNSDSTFQIHQRVTEKRKGFRRQQRHDGDKSPDVSYTRSHCFQSTRERSTIVSTSQRARRNQKTRLALHRMRKSRTSLSTRILTKQRILHSSKCSDTNSHCSECANRDLFLAEFTKRRRCDIPLAKHNTKEDDNEKNSS